MKIIDTIRLTTRIFRRRRLRTGLTILGVGVGMGAIVFLVSLGYGLQRIIIDQIAGSDAVYSLDVKSPDSDAKPLNKAALEQIQAVENVEKVEPVVTAASVQIGVTPTDANEPLLLTVGAYGVNPEFFALEGISFSSGELYLKNAVDEVILTQGLTENFKIPTDKIIGQEIAVYLSSLKENITGDEVPTKMKVVAVIANDTSDNIYVPFGQLEPYSDNQYQLIKAKVTSGAANENLKKSAESDAVRIGKVKDTITAMGFGVETTLDEVEQVKRGFNIARIALGIFGLIALLVAAIGMFNTMTISMLERTREIGIMKAIGASDADIWLLFAAESSLIGILGGVIGVILGMAGGIISNGVFNRLASNYNAQSLDMFSTPIKFAGFILIFALIVGFLTGVYPARRAGRLNPLDALRYE